MSSRALRLGIFLLGAAALHAAGLVFSLPDQQVMVADRRVGIVLVDYSFEAPAPASFSERQSAQDVAIDVLPAEKIDPLPEKAEPESPQVPHQTRSESTATAKAIEVEKKQPQDATTAAVDTVSVARGNVAVEVAKPEKESIVPPPLIRSQSPESTIHRAQLSPLLSERPAGDAGKQSEVAPEQRAQPRYGYQPPPEYPRLARQRGWQGTVKYEVQVHRSGAVGTLLLKSSSGHRSLDDAARKAIRTWSFNPATRGGIPVESWVIIPVHFVLE